MHRVSVLTGGSPFYTTWFDKFAHSLPYKPEVSWVDLLDENLAPFNGRIDRESYSILFDSEDDFLIFVLKWS